MLSGCPHTCPLSIWWSWEACHYYITTTNVGPLQCGEHRPCSETEQVKALNLNKGGIAREVCSSCQLDWPAVIQSDTHEIALLCIY